MSHQQRIMSGQQRGNGQEHIKSLCKHTIVQKCRASKLFIFLEKVILLLSMDA